MQLKLNMPGETMPTPSIEMTGAEQVAIKRHALRRMTLREHEEWETILLHYHGRALGLKKYPGTITHLFYWSWAQMFGLTDAFGQGALALRISETGATQNSILTDCVLKYKADGLGLTPNHFRDIPELGAVVTRWIEAYGVWKAELDELCRKCNKAAA